VWGPPARASCGQPAQVARGPSQLALPAPHCLGTAPAGQPHPGGQVSTVVVVVVVVAVAVALAVAVVAVVVAV
jgi:hypothetical protein